MNEIKQRVSNKQAEKIRDVSYCFVDQVTGVTTRDLASDLLDSRAIIEKQTAIIKEMRDALSYIDCLNMNPKTTELSNTTRWTLSSQKAKSLLERTKDYASVHTSEEIQEEVEVK